MVLPLIIGIAGLAGTAWFADKAGILSLEEAGEEIGEVIGKVMVGVIDALPEVIEGVAPAAVDAVAGSVDATRGALSGKEKAFFTGLTVIIIGITAWWAVKSTLTRPRMRWDQQYTSTNTGFDKS